MMEKEYDDSKGAGVLTSSYKDGYWAGYEARGCK
jgi:hypothetical protein